MADILCAVICAAVTSIATCEQFPSDTRAVNVTNTIALCHSLIERRIFVVFISTNQVFDGSVPIRDAADEACPVSEYGKQKAAVEAYLAEHKNTSAILRLSKVLGRNSEIFRDWAAALGRRTPIFPAADMVISPIRLETCISAIMSIAAARVPRVFQLSGTDDIGYAEIARRIAKKVQAEPSLVVPRPGADLGIDAKFRPSHTTLDTRRLREDFGYPPIDSRQVIEHEVDLAIEGLSKT